MPLLENLNLELCSKLKEIKGLDQMPRLSFLNVSYTVIDNLDFIPDYSNLSYLNLANCKSINNFSMLPKLAKLRTLDISECNVQNKHFPADKLSPDCLVFKDN